MDQNFIKSMPKLGFGLMRLPQNGSEIDIPQTCKMVDLFLSKGFKYFDTAYGYGNGASEIAIGEALVKRYPRNSYYLATKLPAWTAKNTEDAHQMFYTSLQRTGAGYFDFYLLHNMGAQRSHFFDDYGIWEFLAERKKEGLIRHLGFSFHDKAAPLDEILTAHPEMEFVQLQINYVDWENPVIEARKCYEVARRHGKPIIIMEPVKGGTLASLPDEAANVFKSMNPSASLASWAIRYAASLDGVLTVLSGMSSTEQMEDNISYMENFIPLSDKELAAIDKVSNILLSYKTVPCTSCQYCIKGCPMNISIPGCFDAINIYNTFGVLSYAQSRYRFNTSGHDFNKASACIGCGQCEAVCPQHIHIRDELKKVAETLE